jgi:hypothetical protein
VSQENERLAEHQEGLTTGIEIRVREKEEEHKNQKPMKDNKDKNQEIWRRNRERNGNLKGNEW